MGRPLFWGAPLGLGRGKVKLALPQVDHVFRQRPGGQDICPHGHDHHCLHLFLLPDPKGLEEPDLERRRGEKLFQSQTMFILYAKNPGPMDLAILKKGR